MGVGVGVGVEWVWELGLGFVGAMAWYASVMIWERNDRCRTDKLGKRKGNERKWKLGTDFLLFLQHMLL